MFRIVQLLSILVPICYLLAADLPPGVPTADTSYIDAEGTAHVSRVVPVPQTVSPEAQKLLDRKISDSSEPQSLADRRSNTDKWQNATGQRFQQMYPVKIEDQTIAGVHVRAISPLDIPAEKRGRLLINIHGGGFNSDSGSLTETIPVAFMTRTSAIAVLYRLSPENAFPAAVDDVVAVYKEELKSHNASKIALFGTSAGAVLTAEVAVRLEQSGLPLPGALGIFSGFGDFAHVGDSRALFALNGLAGHLDAPSKNRNSDLSYVGSTNLEDPVLSPIYSDLSHLPPTLFITSTRDLLLSGTASLHRAFLRAGVDARLVVFEALAHAFWNDPGLPESKEAHELMSKFFDQQLGR
jgi:acetyl esterase/lipase